MSAGEFITAFYQTDGGGIAEIQVQPETLGLTIGGVENVSSSGPADYPLPVRVSGRASRFWKRARYVTFRWTGAPPAGYDAEGLLKLPVLLPATYTAYSAGGRGTPGTYLGAAIALVRLKGEDS